MLMHQCQIRQLQGRRSNAGGHCQGHQCQDGRLSVARSAVPTHGLSFPWVCTLECQVVPLVTSVSSPSSDLEALTDMAKPCHGYKTSDYGLRAFGQTGRPSRLIYRIGEGLAATPSHACFECKVGNLVLDLSGEPGAVGREDQPRP